MAKTIWVLSALLCIICVVALLIAPLVDPPATRLLSDSFQLLMLCWSLAAACILMAYSQIFAALKPHVQQNTRLLPQHSSSSRPTEDLLDLTCALRF